MKRFVLASVFAGLLSSGAVAQDYNHRDRDRDRGPADIPGDVVKDAAGALLGRQVDRDGDCSVIIERYRRADGDVVERRHRECD